MMDYRKEKVVRRAFDEDSGATAKCSNPSRKQALENTGHEEEIRAWARHALATNGFGDSA